jgi:hypothetical protein
MANPRPLSIVKISNPNSAGAINWGLTVNDRFVYWGEIAQDPTRCYVEGLNSGAKIAWMFPEDFVEVDPVDF